jgi:hypothetical protein
MTKTFNKRASTWAWLDPSLKTCRLGCLKNPPSSQSYSTISQLSHPTLLWQLKSGNSIRRTVHRRYSVFLECTSARVRRVSRPQYVLYHHLSHFDRWTGRGKCRWVKGAQHLLAWYYVMWYVLQYSKTLWCTDGVAYCCLEYCRSIVGVSLLCLSLFALSVTFIILYLSEVCVNV